MECCKCGLKNQSILVKIVDKNSTTIYCLNCLIETLANFDSMRLSENEFLWENDTKFIDDVTGEKGAVMFECQDEVYCLERERMLRLIDHSLYPDEYFALVSKRGVKHQLHDDFYDETNGFALQPAGLLWYEDDCSDDERTELEVLVEILAISDVEYEIEMLDNDWCNLFICGENDKIKITFDENERCVSNDIM